VTRGYCRYDGGGVSLRAKETADPISRGRRQGDATAAAAGGCGLPGEKVDPRGFIASNDLLEDFARGGRSFRPLGEQLPINIILLLPRS